MGYKREKMSLSHAAAITRKDRRFVSQQCSALTPCETKGKAEYYWSDEVLAAIYEAPEYSPRDARELAQARKLEYEVRRLEGELVDQSDVDEVWGGFIAKFRAFALGLLNEHPAARDAITKYLETCAGLPDRFVKGPDAAAEANGHGMGGRASGSVA
jgi:hypothetical protein